MGAHEITDSRFPQSKALPTVAGLLTWLGGGHRHELGERHERSAHAVAGAVVALGAVLAWVVSAVALSESAGWSVPAALALTLVFGLLVGAVTRGTVGGPSRSRRGIGGRAVVAAAVGVLVGELAALVVFSSSIDRRLDERALRDADATPAVAQASASLQQTRDARTALDRAVEQARSQQDKALVVARCEYNPTPACPQTRITGVPGPGPETRTSNELLADAQRDLDAALAARDRQAPELDARIAGEQRALSEARHDVAANAGRGLGARWVAMSDLTVASAGALSLRLATVASCVLLFLLPLILGLWRGQTTHDRRAAARAERERAELEAETAIAVKRAEVRREAEIMWAEHQLTQARMAIEAQVEIDREQQRRRVQKALEGRLEGRLEGPKAPVHAPSHRTFEPLEEDMYLPIAAEAEAASRALAELPAGAGTDDVEALKNATSENLPARIQPADDIEPHVERSTPLIPSLPDATKAAARWIRPLVPPFVARVIDNTTQPLRTARQAFEEVEEITFAFKRTRKVTVNTESSDVGDQPPRRPATAETAPATGRIASSRVDSPQGPAYHDMPNYQRYASLDEAPTEGVGGRYLGSAEREGRLELMEREGPRELMEREGPRELEAPEGPRQLPPAE